MSTYNVRLWEIRKNAGKRRPYEVRWVVAGREKSRSFVTKLLAESFRTDLMKALRAGQGFDTVTGLPETQARDEPWFAHAVAYVDMKWPRAAAKSRRSMAEAMTTVTTVLVSPRRGRPDDQTLRRALYGHAFNPLRRAQTPSPEVAAALAWLGAASLPVSALRDPSNIRRVLNALAIRLDGKPAAGTTTYRKRAVFYNALGYAVERGLLPSNPVDLVQWTAPAVGQVIDRRVVASPDQMVQLLTAVGKQGHRGGHLMAFFGCLYYAGMRPSEALALNIRDCVLPETGWGRLDVATSEPRAGADWTDDGRARDVRQLKRRARAEVRPVPIPPDLVHLLREHVATFDVGEGGRLFRSGAGGPLQETAYGAVWRAARKAALTEAQAASPLARRPYDLRHAAASLWLSAGVPATEVSRRLGHSVAVLLKVYANVVDGQEDAANDRIAGALGEGGHGRLAGSLGDPSTVADDAAGQARDGQAR